MESIVITENEILEALREAGRRSGPEGDGWMSVEEIAVAINHSAKWVREKMRPLVKVGHIAVSERPDTRIDGRACWTPVYKVKA